MSHVEAQVRDYDGKHSGTSAAAVVARDRSRALLQDRCGLQSGKESQPTHAFFRTTAACAGMLGYPISLALGADEPPLRPFMLPWHTSADNVVLQYCTRELGTAETGPGPDRAVTIPLSSLSWVTARKSDSMSDVL